MPQTHSQPGQFCRNLCLLTIGLLTTLSTTAQRTQAYQEPDYHYRNGLELFERSNYAAARYEFRQYLEPRRGNGTQTTLNTGDQNAVDAEYYIALTSLYIDEPGAELLVDRFVKNHSAHPKASQLYGDLGSYYFAREDYPKAIDFLEKAVAQGGNNVRYKYQLALSYYNTQDLQKALPLLNEVKLDPNSTDAPAASYYAGVINFRNRNFNEAVADFRRVENNPTYQNQVPNWIAQALYRQRRFDDLLAYTEPLLRRNNGAGLSEVALFTAEVYYQQNQFAKAIPYYKQYINAAGTKAPGAVRFRYGQSLFRTGAYDDAITQLKTLAGGKDTTAQYAAYTLGVSYLQKQNPAYALNAFDQAGRLSFNRDIQEEARFNHAKLLVDQNNGADAVKELTAFLKEYPDSKFENEANELVGEAYSASNNYPAAIAYIEGLKRRTPKINATYQRLTYNQGVSEFNAQRYPQAVANFDKSLRNPVDNDLQQATQFWKAEAYSAGKQYDTAIPLYTAMAKGSGEYATKSQYALGYAYYNKKDYARALPYFRDFISRKSDADDQAQVLDATIRLADVYLAGKQYENALRYYDQAISQNAPDKDYAAYQKGVVLSYVGRDAEAKAQFDQVQRQYPNSRFVDESLFQTANVDFEKGAYQVAIRGFSKLIDGRSNSRLIPAALLKRAIAYGNLQQYDPAVADYKRILDDYGDSEQAQSALLGIQNTLNDAGRPEEFSQVLGQYKKSNPGSTDVERVQFENARNIYANEKYDQAIRAFITFLQEYPASPNTNEARYYLAESYRLTNDAANALRYYNQIITDNRSDFLVRAATRAADLERQQKNYPRAIRNYQLVIGKADDKAAQVTAQLGLMDTYFAMPKLDSAAVIARELVTAGNVVPGAQNRAQLMLGKVAYNKNDYKTAQTEFDRTIALAKDVNGAEAQYYLGEMLYKQKKHKESIASLLKFNQDFSDFEYWKGKAFILVADNNVALDEPAQAKAVLNSIIENSADQTIVAEAKQKLAGLN